MLSFSSLNILTDSRILSAVVSYPLQLLTKVLTITIAILHSLLVFSHQTSGLLLCDSDSDGTERHKPSRAGIMEKN